MKIFGTTDPVIKRKTIYFYLSIFVSLAAISAIKMFEPLSTLVEIFLRGIAAASLIATIFLGWELWQDIQDQKQYNNNQKLLSYIEGGLNEK